MINLTIEMSTLRRMNFTLKFISILTFILSSVPGISQSKKVNLIEKFKAVGLPVSKFEREPLVSLTGYNYKLTAFSGDLKYMAVSRSYSRKESEIMDIVVVKLKNLKETVMLDTQTMIRYGRPNGYLYDLSFNDKDLLVATIGDGMAGASFLTFDPEKKETLKDEYLDDCIEDEGDYDDKGDYFYDQKMADLKRIFPNKTNILLSEITMKLKAVDTVGYFTQGFFPNDNSIFYLPHGTGKLRLIHNFSDPSQNDNIDGLWGTTDKAYYLLKDKKHNYFFRYDIKANAVTLLEKYPPHNHFSYIYSYELKNGDTLLAFEVENNSPEADETLKLFRYSNGSLYKIEDYPLLKEVSYLKDQNLLLLYYLKDGKRCLDVRNLNL